MTLMAILAEKVREGDKLIHANSGMILGASPVISAEKTKTGRCMIGLGDRHQWHEADQLLIIDRPKGKR